jgi:putative endopeptidase
MMVAKLSPRRERDRNLMYIFKWHTFPGFAIVSRTVSWIGTEIQDCRCQTPAVHPLKFVNSGRVFSLHLQIGRTFAAFNKYRFMKIFSGKMLRLSLILLAAAGLLAFVGHEVKSGSKPGKGIDLANFDKSVRPQDNFFQYVNGGWIKKNPIPATESRWGSFNELRDKNREIMRKVLEAAVKDKNAAKGSSQQLIGDFYASGLDTAGIERMGIKPVQGELEKINALTNASDIITRTAEMHRYGVYPFFAVYVDQDAKISTQYALHIYQSGLGMPDRDYYTKTDKRSTDIQAQYVDHVAKMLELSGTEKNKAAGDAKRIMELETKLASASMTRVESRDPHAVYNKMTFDELTAKYPAIDWKRYMEIIGASSVKEVIVGQPEFIKTVNELFAKPDINLVKAYMRWHLIQGMAPFLNSEIVNENFRFNGTTLTGVKSLDPRWKRVLDNTNIFLGEALGQEYVKVAFKPDAKEKMLKIVENLKAALRQRIGELDWMSEATKKQAVEKLNTLVTKIGYPDKWKDYTGLEIKRDAYASNVINASAFEFNRMINKLGKPIDRQEWGMTPPTINAYYNPAMNEIVFPAGILQAPFFDPEADDAVNYGGIGAVIGHELTHGYDDQGRQFDAQGNLKDWWTKEDADKFTERAQYLVKQFSAYEVLDSVFVNGELTLGENIADLGGLKIAYLAYQKSLKGKPTPEKIDGFTGPQRFFISWATVWRVNERPESMRQRAITDPHSPPRFRVNGPLSNLPEFYAAFDVKEGDPMMRPGSLRANIW